MQGIAAKLVVGLAITAIGMFGADISLGTWKFNAAKAKSTATNKLKSRTDVYAATSDGGIKVTRTELRADGTTYNISYTCKYDGKPCPVTGGQFDTISVKRVDANTTSYEAAKTGGKISSPMRFHRVAPESCAGRVVVSREWYMSVKPSVLDQERG